MKSLSKIFIVLACFLLTQSPALSDKSSDENKSEQEVVHDLSGRWKVLMTNSLSRKQVTIQIDQKDGRLRGYLMARGYQELKLDGRRDKDQKIKLWGTHYDRIGKSYDYEFKGRFEGEPGQEKLVGKSEFFGKRYQFTGVRAKKKKKSSR